MTELDDRIMNFLRYDSTGTNSPMPILSLEIKYLEAVAGNISFFELGALIKSLRKILIGNKYLSPNAITLQTKTSSDEIFNFDQLLNRIDNGKNKLSIQNSNINTSLSGIISVKSISKELKVRLKNLDLDNTKIE